MMEISNDDPFKFKEPDLSSFTDATAEEIAVAKKYTAIRFIIREEGENAHTSWLKVGVQSFRFSLTKDTPEEASWTCWMLAKAVLSIQRDAAEELTRLQASIESLAIRSESVCVCEELREWRRDSP